MVIPKRYTVLLARILFVMMPPLATTIIQKLLKVAATTQFKAKFNKTYLT